MTPRVTRLLRTVTCCLLPFAAAQACGPDFYHDVFVRSAQPDLPKQFVQGRLGLLQTGFGRAYDLVAYRYLNGGTFDAAEQKNWSPNLSVTEQANAELDAPAAEASNSPTPDDPAADWSKLRSQYPDPPAGAIDQNGSLKVKTQGGAEYEQNYLNCADDAFRVAAATLQARSATWGRTSPAVQDWLRAQDVVFSDCSGADRMPAAAPANSPALLVQDRAYQTAAAKFYGSDLAGAATGFEAIGKDPGSPWQPSAGYLVGRVLIRQAFFAKPAVSDRAEYDPALMQAAQRQLQAYLASHPPQRWHAAAEAQLALVRLRSEPEQRLHELAALVGGPGHDSNYPQDATDLLWIISNGTPDGLRAEPEPWQTIADPAHPGQTRTMTPQEMEAVANTTRNGAWSGSETIRSQADVVDWVLTLQSLAPSVPDHALQQWRQKHSMPWLVAALMRFPDETAAPDDLLRAAAAVPADSPAWQTVTYHHARLLLGTRRVADARAVLGDFDTRLKALPELQREPSTVNAVRGLGMLAAATLPEFLSQVSRTMLVTSSEEASSVSECQEVMKNPKRHYGCVDPIAPDQLDTDAAAVMNTQAPLSVWLSAAGSAALPQQLRTAIALEGWTRAVLLKNAPAARDVPAAGSCCGARAGRCAIPACRLDDAGKEPGPVALPERGARSVRTRMTLSKAIAITGAIGPMEARLTS